MKISARIQLAAGAREVRTLHRDPVVIQSDATWRIVDERPSANLLSVFTAHQMGGCAAGSIESVRRGRKPPASPPREPLGLRRVGLPTSLGVNPQLSILGIVAASAERMIVAG